MRAAIFTGPEAIEVAHVARPEPGPGQVRVRLQGCGVCGSNLPVWEGRPWFHYPFAPGAPGHEGWGEIDALGEGVKAPALGERVALLSFQAFAEYDLAGADQVLVLPEALRELPFPGEPLGCAMNVLRRAALEPGQKVAIIGIGFLGALLTKLASQAGARVIAIARRPSALAMARRLGAAETLTMNANAQGEVVARVRDLTRGQGCACVIEAVGAQETLDLAGELTAVRGRLVIAGYHQDGPRQVNMQSWNWKGIDVINAHERDPQVYLRGMREAVEMMASGQFDPTPLYTHSFALSELPAAFKTMRERPEGFFKAWVKP